MKTFKLVTGILSIVIAAVVSVQGFAAGVADALGGTTTGAGGAGLIVAVMLIAAGIVSITTRNAVKNGGNVALIIIAGIAAVVSFACHGTFKDLEIWGCWCLVIAVAAAVSARNNRKN